MAYVRIHDAQVWSIDVKRKWTVVTIRIPTASLAAQGARRILGKAKGRKAFRGIRKKARR